jgi:hypothetical protein
MNIYLIMNVLLILMHLKVESCIGRTVIYFFHIGQIFDIFANYKKGVLDSQPQVIKFTSCLPMVGDFLRVLRLLPSLKLVAMI